MKNKWLKKTFGCLLATALVVGSMVGCGSTDVKESTSTKESEATTNKEQSTPVSSEQNVEEKFEVSYPMDGTTTLTIAYQTQTAVTANYKDLTETPFWKAWQENTGIKLEAMELSKDQMNLLLTSDELPDLILMKPYSYPGGPELAILDNVIEPLNAYEKYIPDLLETLNSDDRYYKASTTDSGNLIGAPFVRGDNYLLCSQGMIIRKDWLEELDMDIPTTPDQLYDTLVAFRDKKGAAEALSSDPWQLKNYYLQDGLITSGFGLPTADFYIEDGKVHYGFAEPEIKDCYAFLNKLFEENLMERDYGTWDGAVYKNNIVGGNSGLTAGSVGGNLGSWMTETVATNPTYELTGVPSLVQKEGDKAKGDASNFCIPGAFLVMTKQCDNKEAAAQFINYGYTEEGRMFFNYGIEGESYTVVDGVPTYTEFVTKNPDGWTMQQALAGYCMSWSEGPFVQEKGYMLQYASMPQQIEAITNWTNTDYMDYQLPLLAISLDDSEEYSKINSEISTFIDEMVVAYVTGEKSLDNFEVEYMEKMKTLGVDRLIEIQQKAYDAYNAR